MGTSDSVEAEEGGTESDLEVRARKIDELQHLLFRCSEELRSLATDQPSVALSDYPITNQPPSPNTSARRKPSDMGDWARIAYDNRRLRDSVFNDPGLFADPAWDILLDLTRSESAGRRLSTTSLSIGACVPATTALRWIMVLEERGLVRREDDLLDGRRTFIRLTRQGKDMMQRYFAELARRRDGATLFFRE